MPTRRKCMYRELKILWESEITQSTPGKIIKLKIVDSHPFSPTLWIDRFDGMISERRTMKLKDLREIKHVMEAAETALAELTEHYDAMKPAKHSFSGKCLLCFSDLRDAEYLDHYKSSICDECAITIIGDNLDDEWHAVCQGKNKAEVVAKLQTDLLFKADFNKLRNQILKIQGLRCH